MDARRDRARTASFVIHPQHRGRLASLDDRRIQPLAKSSHETVVRKAKECSSQAAEYSCQHRGDSEHNERRARSWVCRKNGGKVSRVVRCADCKSLAGGEDAMREQPWYCEFRE